MLTSQGLALTMLHAERAEPQSTGDTYDLFTKETECVAASELLFQSPQFIYSDTPQQCCHLALRSTTQNTAVVECIIDRNVLHASKNGHKF
jgi:hypothetical protein